MSPTKWQVKYWDGSKSGLFDTVADACRAACRGLRDWMNEDDVIVSFYDAMSGEHRLYVGDISDGESDACAKVYPVEA